MSGDLAHDSADVLLRSLWPYLQNRAIPTRFLYQRSGAIIEDGLQSEDTRGHNVPAIEVEARAIEYIGTQIPDPLDIVDIGPGNGSHTLALLKRILSSGFQMKRYRGLDASIEMLAMCHSRLALSFPSADIQVVIWDFEDSPTKHLTNPRLDTPSVILMVGNTLAGVEDPLSSLQNIAASSRTEDMFLLHVNGFGTEDEGSLLRRFDSAFFVRSLLALLHAIGISSSTGAIRTRFSRELTAVVSEFMFHEPVEIFLDDDVICFNGSDSIRCFLSRRFTDADILRLLALSGWTFDAEFKDPSSVHLVFVAHCARG